MIIQHNIMALNSYNKLSGNNSMVQKNLEKLSSGYRINRAGDDAAGLAISEKMRAQITGLERAKLNAQDGISLVQTGEGALTEVHSMLNRLVELGTESANGIYQAEDREKIQAEVDQITDEIDRISKATNFNGIKLLDGSLSTTQVADAVKKGDVLNIDAGTNKVTINDNRAGDSPETLVAASKGSTSISTANIAAGTGNTLFSSFDVRYIDESGAEQTKTFNVQQGATADDTIKNLGQALNEIGITASVNGGLIKFESSNAGSHGTQVLGVTVKRTGMTTQNANDGTAITNPTEARIFDEKTVLGKDAVKTNTLAFDRDFAAGDTITLGDKTYEIAAADGVQKVKAGNVAVVLGTNANGAVDNDATLKHLVNALIANGVEARTTGTAREIGIDNLKDISIQKAEIASSVDSNAITAKFAAAKHGVWEATAVGGNTCAGQSLTVKYYDENGAEQTRTVSYTGAAAATDNAAAIVNAIKNDEVLNKIFDAKVVDGSAVGTKDGIQLTAVKAGDKGIAKALSIASTDPTNDVIKAGSFQTVAKGIDEGKGFTFNNNVQSGDTVTVAGKTFEFVEEDEVSNVKDGNLAVVIGSGAAATAKNFNEALKAAGFATDYTANSTGVRVIADDFSLTDTSVSAGAGGLTLQIGDTADDFNKVTVSVEDMSAKGLGLDGLQVTDQGLSAESIDKVKAAIEKVSVNRGRLGALQNRLEHTINNLATTTENMTAAESRIRDTDMAKEMMNFTKNNVLVQAAQAMLAQANQQPQQVLQLLR